MGVIPIDRYIFDSLRLIFSYFPSGIFSFRVSVLEAKSRTLSRSYVEPWRRKNKGTGGKDRRETGTKRWPSVAARIR